MYIHNWVSRERQSKRSVHRYRHLYHKNRHLYKNHVHTARVFFFFADIVYLLNVTNYILCARIHYYTISQVYAPYMV